MLKRALIKGVMIYGMSRMEKERLKVLVIAEAANPDWTSVPLIGWSHAAALRSVCDAHLVTQIRNRRAILNQGWKEGVDFTAIDSERLNRPIYRFSLFLRGGDKSAWTISTALGSLVYPYFEYLCWKAFKARLVAGDFDVVHRITPVSPTAPSYLAKKLRKINVPFVVGPLNGGVAWPPQFRDVQHKEKEWLSYIRSIYRWLPGYRSLLKNCSAIISGSSATFNQLPKRIRHKQFFVAENAIDPKRFSLTHERAYGLPLKGAFVGRLVPYKGADMALEALEPLLKSGKIKFDIYGDGPERANLEAVVDTLGLSGYVTIHGFVDHAELQNELIKADILIFPSIREFGGGVVLESMALGVVPIVVDYAGPAELVTDEVGYLIAMGDRESIIVNLRANLSVICADPEQLEVRRRAGIAKVNECYTWARKAEKSKEIYLWITGRGPKPKYQRPPTQDNGQA